MHSLLDVHHGLEVDRAAAKSSESFGPRALFVTETGSGETGHYIHWLSQYAVRLGYHPFLIDCTSTFGYNGCLSLFNLQYPIDIECGLSFSPGVFMFCGHEKESKPALFRDRLSRLSLLSIEKMTRDERSRVGGVFMNYGGLNRLDVEEADTGRGKEDPIDTLLNVVQECDIDRLFVVGSAWLRFKIFQRAVQRGQEMPGSLLEVGAEFPRSDGFPCKLFLLDGCTTPVGVPHQGRQQWLRYFVGTSTCPLRPTLVTVKVSAIRLAVLGNKDDSAMTTMMPMMDDPNTELPRTDPAAIQFLTVQDVDLKGRILAVSTANEFRTLPDGSTRRHTFSEFEDAVRGAFVKGFAVVESVAPDTITLLLSNPSLLSDDAPCLFVTSEHLHSS
ncbi:polyribonucleotide 5'-hydroxyl-kinase [Angomonas deanei]|nr:polyribonucleotide 5'-hydroxyl-kinase [Angomonas deanei]|eukprot:EPY41639.1 polyribonucleotide 5'-hydroxyl-kinase [Angomonas deanei]